MKIILTGFESFAGRRINSAMQTVKAIDLDCQKYELPVSFNKIEASLDEILKENPDYVFMCGEASKYDGIKIEVEAHNIASGTDNDGTSKNDEIIDKNVNNTLKTKFKLPHEIKNIAYSNDAGKYLCNYSYFYMLNKTASMKSKVIFIHFPLTVENGGIFTLDSHVENLENIIKTLIGLDN